jgi:tetratricopeptide (TPR) repeat protein
MAPRKLSNYVFLARLLAAEAGPDEIYTKLSYIPGAENYMIDLAMGWLYEQAKNYTNAIELYNRAEENMEAPKDTRNLAQLFKARTYANQNQPEQALQELEKIGPDSIANNQIDLIKIRLLLTMQQNEEANALIEKLCQIAVEKPDKVLLQKMVELYLNKQKPDEALQLCEKIQQKLPNDPQPHILRASVLEALGRRTEAIEGYRQAIKLQPGMLGTYRLLAKALDAEQRPQEVLDALDDLEKTGQSGRSAALFERGSLFEEWGMQSQAIESYEALAASGYGKNPTLQLYLGRTFAQLGEKDRAIEILGKIPDFSKDYIPAQLLRAHLTEKAESKLVILRTVQTKDPMRIDTFTTIVNTLIEANRPEEALAEFRSFIQQYDQNTELPDELRYPATQVILLAEDRPSAQNLCMEIAIQHGGRWWRQFAILLNMREQPDLAATMLPPQAESNFYETLLGLCYACQIDNADLIRQWYDRMDQINKQAQEKPNSRQIPTVYKLCANLAVGKTQQAETELAGIPDSGSVNYSIASELVSHSIANQNSSEAVALLKAYMAIDLGIPALSQEWALDLLQARPTFQWAAALVMSVSADPEIIEKVLQLVEPKDSYLAKTIQAKSWLNNKEYEKAATLYGELVQARQGQKGQSDVLLFQGMALEYMGQLEEALQIYQQVWQEAKNPIAANNAAYIISVLFPKDKDKLTTAKELIEATIQTMPQEPTFHDTRGWILYLQGDYEAAGKELFQAVKKLPDSPEVHYHAGMAAKALGHNQLAIWHLAATVQICRKLQKEGTELSSSVAEQMRIAQENLEELELNQP